MIPNAAKPLIDRGLGLARGTAKQAGRLAGRFSADAFGQAERVRAGVTRRPKELDDVTIARKVETELFRDFPAVKGKVDIDVVDGKAELRGQVKTQAEIAALETRVRAVPEVLDVNNLLHLPKTQSPTRAGASKRQQKKDVVGGGGRARSQTRGRVTDDRTADIAKDAEPRPKDLAAQRKGRQPAPLGSKDFGNGSPAAKPAPAKSAKPVNQAQSKAHEIAGGAKASDAPARKPLPPTPAPPAPASEKESVTPASPAAPAAPATPAKESVSS